MRRNPKKMISTLIRMRMIAPFAYLLALTLVSLPVRGFTPALNWRALYQLPGFKHPRELARGSGSTLFADADAATTSSPSSSASTDRLKWEIVQLGAALDRGQAYNPTSGEYYGATMEAAKAKVEELIALGSPADTLEDIAGEWELVLSTVPHGIFRSSPFFLAVQEAFTFAENRYDGCALRSN